MKQAQVQSSKAGRFFWGLEIECFLPQEAMNELRISIGQYHHGRPLPPPFPEGWTAERDGSLRTDRPGYVPLEVVSPILQGREGIEQVKQVAKILRERGGFCNFSTGLHVHLSCKSVVGNISAAVAEWVAKLLYQTAMHETALYASTGTHRRENGGYAMSIKLQQQTADKVRKAPNRRKPELLRDAVYGLGRYHSLNLTNLFTSKGTCEFRCYAGTLSWEKMVGHICTCLALAERATETTRMDWQAVASEKTYHTKGQGLRELNRLFYLTGWTLGRRDVGKPEVEMAGWIADPEDLKSVKATLRNLAKKYDKAGN